MDNAIRGRCHSSSSSSVGDQKPARFQSFVKSDSSDGGNGGDSADSLTSQMRGCNVAGAPVAPPSALLLNRRSAPAAFAPFAPSPADLSLENARLGHEARLWRHAKDMFFEKLGFDSPQAMNDAVENSLDAQADAANGAPDKKLRRN